MLIWSAPWASAEFQLTTIVTRSRTPRTAARPAKYLTQNHADGDIGLERQNCSRPGLNSPANTPEATTAAHRSATIQALPGSWLATSKASSWPLADQDCISGRSAK